MGFSGTMHHLCLNIAVKENTLTLWLNPQRGASIGENNHARVYITFLESGNVHMVRKIV
jgi:hypothetical protein